MIRLLFLLLSFYISSQTNQNSKEYNLVLEIPNIKTAGIIYIAVYDNAEGFDSGDDSREIMAYNIIEPVSKEIYQ